MNFEEMVDEIRRSALCCRTSEEVRVLLDTTPHGSYASNIFYDRYVELCDHEAPEKAKKCIIAKEAKILFENAIKNSKAKEIFRIRWKELSESEVSLRIKECVTAEDAFLLLHTINNNTYHLDCSEREVCRVLWIKLSNEEVFEKIKKCKTVEDVRSQMERVDSGSFAYRMYRSLMLQLLDSVVFEKVQGCKTVNDFMELLNSIPRGSSGMMEARVREVVMAIMFDKKQEILVGEARWKVMDCKTMEEAASLFLEMRERATGDSPAKRICEANWMEFYLGLK